MTNRTIRIDSMTMRYLFLIGSVFMVAMFLVDLRVNMLIRVNSLKKHCEQYHYRHEKIN